MAARLPHPESYARRSFVVGAAAGLALGSVPEFALGQTSASFEAGLLRMVREKFSGQQEPLNVIVPQGSQANIAPVVAAFTNDTGIQISLSMVPPDEINAELVLTGMLGTSKYDVALPATFGLPDLVSADVLFPLDAYAATYEPAGFRDGIIYPTGDTVDGKIFGFQTDGDAYLMFYHKGMLSDPDMRKQYADRYGYQLEVPPTWEELDQQMAFFHAPDAGRYGGILFRTPRYAVWEWWGRFHAKGVWPFAPDMQPQIQSDAGLAALEEMVAATAHLADGVDTMGLFDNWGRYDRGDVYANIGWGGTQKFLNSPEAKMRDRMVFGPTPGGVIDGANLAVPYFNWGWNYVVTRLSSRPELAYLFCLFASSPRMSTVAVGQSDGFFDPFRAEHYDDPEIIKAYSKPFLKVHQQTMQRAIPDLYLKWQGDYVNALAEGIDAVLHGSTRPKTALRRIAQKWELITSRAGRKDQIARWNGLRSKYPVAVRRALKDL